MTKLVSFLVALCIVVACQAPRPSAHATAPVSRGPAHGLVQAPALPNILFILADDMRFEQLQYMPQTMQLLAPQSVRFDQAFVHSPLCGPNRTSLLTGVYVHTHRIDCNSISASSFGTREHLGTMLQAKGYRTAEVGKWLNGLTAGRMPVWPWVQPGWNVWRAFAGDGGYYGFKLLTEKSTVKTYDTSTYSTTVLGQLARDFIHNTSADQPFFLYFTPKAPHDPYVAENEADKKFGNHQPFPRSSAFNEADVSDKPSNIQALPLLTAAQMVQAEQTWHKQVATAQSLDRQVAALLTDLQQAGRLDDTVVFFTSDNGVVNAEHRLLDGKSCPYEECIHVPLLVRVPGVLPRVDTDHLVSTVDLTATVLALAKASRPLPGQNLLPLLASPTAPWQSDVLVEYLSTTKEDEGRPPFAAVRSRTDIYIEYLNGEREYYDLATDPDQLTNRITDPAVQARVTALTARLADYRTR